MVPSPFSDGFREFVRDNIVSVEQIQVLSLLSAQPDRVWSARELSTEVTSTPASILHRLGLLAQRKLVEGDEHDGFRYRSDAKHDPFVRELRAQFIERPVSVIGLIFSSSSATLQSFSDAFRISGEDRDNS